jgi:hypothetical protein
MAVDSRFVVNLKGKEFVMLGGLLQLAHEMEIISIETALVLELCNAAERSYVVKATGRFHGEAVDRIWSAYGDASPANSQMRGAELRHAETRAIARMLRMATNVAMTAFEELGPDADALPLAPAPTNGQPAKHAQQCEYKSASGEPCKRFLTGNQCNTSKTAIGHYVCAEHLAVIQRARAAKAQQATANDLVEEELPVP